MRSYKGATPIQASIACHQRVLLEHEKALKEFSAAWASILQDAPAGGVEIAPIPSSSVTPHATTHKPSGTDPLATAAAITLHANLANAIGVADSFARSDHAHALTTGAASSLSAATANAAGSGDPLARADHLHAILSAAPSGGYAAAAAVGAGADLMRASAVLPYPDKLMSPTGELLAFTDDATYGALLTPSGSFLQTELSLMAPGGTTPLVVGPNGTMGRGQYTDTSLMFHGLVSISNAIRVVGWDLQGLAATGTGGVQGIRSTVTDTPSGVSTNEIIGIGFQVKAGSANAQGNYAGLRSELVAPVGNSASRGTIRLFPAKAPATAVNQTYVAAYFFTVEAGFSAALGTITGDCVGYKQEVAFALGARKRGVQVINGIETTLNDFICNLAGKGLVNKDTQGTPEFWRTYVGATGLKDASYAMDSTEAVVVTRGATATGVVTLNIQDLGTAAPTT